MAKLLSEDEARELWAKTRSRSHVEYPWDEWFDGRTRILCRGEDFTIRADTFRTAAYAAAKARGLVVRGSLRGKDRVALQCTGTRGE